MTIWVLNLLKIFTWILQLKKWQFRSFNKNCTRLQAQIPPHHLMCLCSCASMNEAKWNLQREKKPPSASPPRTLLHLPPVSLAPALRLYLCRLRYPQALWLCLCSKGTLSTTVEQTKRGGLKERRGCKERDGSEGGFCNFNRLVHVGSWWWHDGFWTFSQVHIKDLDSHFVSLRTQMRISSRLRTQMVTSLVQGPNRGSIKSLRT
jgi:hypothetical protein